jgi:hypothetical protein
VGTILRGLLWIIFLPLRIIRTVFKVGQAAACLISLVSIAVIVGVVILVLMVTHHH